MPIEWLRRYGLVILITAVATVAGVWAVSSLGNFVHVPFDVRTVVILTIAAVFLIAAARVFFSNNGRAVPVRYVVAFDAVVFVVLGTAATVLACSQWETAVLLAGSSLLIGGFVGLLFGYPQGVAQQAATQTAQQAAGQNANQANAVAVNAAQDPAQAPAAAPAAPQALAPAPAAQPAPAPVPAAPGGARAQNLVAESAATLGKVIAGFTLAKVQGIGAYFSQFTGQIGPALGSSDPAHASVLAGVILTYFAATGFLCGLFLPPYFMSEVI